MKKLLVSLSILTVSIGLFAQTADKSPFEKYGYKKQIMYTSSKGEFEEFHDGADIVEIGSVLFNTKINQVVGFVSEEQETADVPSATATMSIDPMCEKYYWITPYAYCLNNPVRYIDPRGKDIVDANGRIMYRNGQWLSNATEGAKLIASGMHLTPIGQESFNELANANYGVQLVYDQTSDIGKVGQTERSYDSNGYTTGAIITIFEKNLTRELNNLTALQISGQNPVTAGATESQIAMLKEGIPTQKERIGQVGVHETTHVVNPNAWASKGGDFESVAVQAEITAIKETSMNKPLPIPKLEVSKPEIRITLP